MSLISSLMKSAARYGVARKTTGKGLASTALGFVATKLFTRSIPGAMMVGGAILGKHLWDKKREKDARKAFEQSDHERPSPAAHVDPAAAPGQPVPGNDPTQLGEIGRTG